MRSDEDGLPQIAPTSKGLGARIGPVGKGDLEPKDGKVYPGGGGMSVSPHPPDNLRPYRRPPKHGGTDATLNVYEMDTDELPEGLASRWDPPDSRTHLVIEPSREMPLEEYQRLLEETRPFWRVI